VLQRVERGLATSGYVDVGQGVGVGLVLLYSEWEFAKQAFQMGTGLDVQDCACKWGQPGKGRQR